MKYLLWLFIPILLLGQVKTVTQTGVKRSMIRGDATTLTWTVSGDYSSDSLLFIAMDNDSNAVLRLTTSGGLTASYSSPNTTITGTIHAATTENFIAQNYLYDISSVTDSVTLIMGLLSVIADVSNLEDTVLAPIPYYTLPLSPPDYDTTFVMGLNSDSTWNEINATTLRGITGSGGVGSLPDSIIYTSETADFVTKSTTQTVTGEKTFSNSKTVFSGDSVGVRGDLTVDGGVYFYGSDGDINNNGAINSVDINLLQNYLNYNSNLTKPQKIIADINGDGRIDWDDREIISSLTGYLTGTPEYIARRDSIVRIVNTKARKSSYGNFDVDGTLQVDSTITIGEYTLPDIDGSSGQVLRTNGSGVLFWASDATGAGGAAYTDSIVINGRHIPGDSVATIDGIDSLLKVSGDSYKLSYSGSTIDSWLDGLNSWTTGLANPSALLRIGKTGREIYFNNAFGGGSDYWIIDYIQHPFNLPYSNQIMREFRTDYYNDTLKTFQSIANLTYLDTTGSAIWHPDGFSYVHNLNSLGVGDLPDSTTAVFNGGGTVGVQFQLQEANKTAGAKRYPMKVKGFEFKFGSTPYYTYPVVYGYYSDLTSNTPNLETAYHFYGLGDFPSYFGGNLQVVGDITMGGDTVLTRTDTLSILATQYDISNLGASDTSHYSLFGWVIGLQDTVNKFLETTDLPDSIVYTSEISGDTSDYTITEMDSLLNLAAQADNIYSDTLSYSWGIMDTTTVGALPGWKVPNNITITEISAYTDANTCTFNLEERGETTPNTAGTDVMSSDLVADNDQQETGTFSNAAIARNAWLVPTISATGDVAIFSITVRYVKTN